MPLLFAAALAAQAAPPAKPAPRPAAAAPVFRPPGVIRLASRNDFLTTVLSIKGALFTRTLRVFATVEQVEPMALAGLEPRRQTLILFGDKISAGAMLDGPPAAGLDWPLRMLVVEEAPDMVAIYWPDVFQLAAHSRAGKPEKLAALARQLAEVAAEGATPFKPQK